MEKYLTHLSVSDDLCVELKKEFYANSNLAKKFTAGEKTLEILEVIRNNDMNNCNIANAIAIKLSKIINCEARARYYIQKANTQLIPHRDYGTITAINIMLEASSPIIWDEKFNIMYKCALLNVQEVHSVKTDDTDRVFLKLSIFDKEYKEILPLIKGKESEFLTL